MTPYELIEWMKIHPSCPDNLRKKSWCDWTLRDLVHAGTNCRAKLELKLVPVTEHDNVARG